MKQMKQIEVHLMRLLAGACSLFVLLALAPMAAAQQAVPAKANQISSVVPAATAPAATNQAASSTAKTGLAAKAAAKPVEEEETAAPNSPDHQGIKVHGHWVLQVKNADGSLGERREFNNSLVTTGQGITGNQLLAGLLAGDLVTGFPGIFFLTTTPTPPTTDLTNVCFASAPVGTIGPGANSTICYSYTIAPFTNVYPGVTNATGLNFTVQYAPSVNLVLSGNYTVPTGLTEITLVQTFFWTCIPEGTSAGSVMYNLNILGGTYTPGVVYSDSGGQENTSPHSCTTGIGGGVGSAGPLVFTSTVVPGGPLTVIPGQIIAVTVTITFS
ncbi:MAG: hypothetical protein ABSC77_09470 [Terracidiphilus sp.]|jgi:hypothetical protein